MRRFAELSATRADHRAQRHPGVDATCCSRELKEVTGKKTVAEVWPDLRLIVHGGTKFDPYRDLFQKEIGSDLVKFCEVYPCSEGFIATEDPRYGLLRIVPDHDIFFEFVPVDELGKEFPTRHTLANVEVGVQYAVVLTTCAGVWSYLVGDTVAFEQRDPPLIRFTGRTKYFLSAFGEHLISEEVEKAVAHAATVCGVNALDFHVGPVFPSQPGRAGAPPVPDRVRGRMPGHRPVRERDRRGADAASTRTTARTASATWRCSCREVRVVKRGGFDEWMKARGKYGGQNKVPRMDNSGTMTKDMANVVRRTRVGGVISAQARASVR